MRRLDEMIEHVLAVARSVLEATQEDNQLGMHLGETHLDQGPLTGVAHRLLDFSFGFLVIAGSILGYTAYIYLLSHVSAAKAATYAYVNPIIAVVLGWLLANEPLGMRTNVAAGVTLAGVAIITLAQGTSGAKTGEHPLPTPSPNQERSAA